MKTKSMKEDHVDEKHTLNELIHNEIHMQVKISPAIPTYFSALGLCTLTSGRIHMIRPLARFLPVRLTLRRPGGRRLEGSTNRSLAEN